MAARPRTARIDGRPEHAIEPVRHYDELALERLVPLRDRTTAREPRIEVRQRPGEVVLAVCRGHGVVERARLLVEREALAREHPQTSVHCTQLSQQVVPAEDIHRVRRCRRSGNAVNQPRGFVAQFADGSRRTAGRGSPFLRAVVGVDVVWIVLPDGEHQPDVRLGEGIHRGNGP